jgi:hypothetical protein
MEYGNKVQVLVLDDCKHEACFITKKEYYANALDFIKMLREPHGRIYEFRYIFLDELDEFTEQNKWYAVNRELIPHPLDQDYNEFSSAFDFLWDIGREVFE